MKKLYKLYDVLEGASTIGYYDTLKEVAKACNEYEAETDGECDFELLKFNPRHDGYQIIDKWVYNNVTVKIENTDKRFMELITVYTVTRNYIETGIAWEISDGQYMYRVNENE